MTDTPREAPRSRPRPAARRIVIAGGGAAGLTLAIALKRALAAMVEVVVCDPALARDPAEDRRAYTVAAGPRNMLAALGLWETIDRTAQPLRQMIITDSALDDPIRPTFLSFDGEVAPGKPFAHLVESRVLTQALLGGAKDCGVTLAPSGILEVRPGPRVATATRADGETIEAALVVAADGARSRLREAAGIGWVGWSYPQTGIAATVRHKRDHEGRAFQHFLPAGPFASLPLPPGLSAQGERTHRSSIVWTERTDAVPALLAADADRQRDEVEKRFGLKLGELTLETPLQPFPLAFGIARRFTADRLALLGDAAHVIHPLAGQGLNLGLADAAALAQAIADTVRLGLDPGRAETLAVYERARRFDTVAMGAATDGLNRLFANDVLPVRLARDLGLGLVDRMPELKRLFIREAAGVTGEMPRLMRGVAL